MLPSGLRNGDRAWTLSLKPPDLQCLNAPNTVGLTMLQPRGEAIALQMQGVYMGEFDRRWGIGSFSSLWCDPWLLELLRRFHFRRFCPPRRYGLPMMNPKELTRTL